MQDFLENFSHKWSGKVQFSTFITTETVHGAKGVKVTKIPYHK